MIETATQTLVTYSRNPSQITQQVDTRGTRARSETTVSLNCSSDNHTPGLKDIRYTCSADESFSPEVVSE